MTKEEIGAVLKGLRLSCGLTQKEVANKLGRNQPIIGHWETGYAQPDANTLFTLCEIYGTTVDDAFGFKERDVTISKKDLHLIKMYNKLDAHGKELIDFLLTKEYERIAATKENKVPQQEVPTRIISYYYKSASAGTGQIVFDSPPDKDIEIPDIPEYRNVSYSIGVNGDSMTPKYHDGDILLVEATENVRKGEIGIFYMDGECYVKKLGTNELISLNPQYDNIHINESFRCMGRVIGKL